jgi:hypothetical protein
MIRDRQVVAPALTVPETGASRRPASRERNPLEPETASIIGAAPWLASNIDWLPNPAASAATALDRAHRAGVLARVELPPLTREETREPVGEHAELFYDETGRNPFYFEQLARAPVDTLPTRAQWRLRSRRSI